jgi:hypothetical protein
MGKKVPDSFGETTDAPIHHRPARSVFERVGNIILKLTIGIDRDRACRQTIGFQPINAHKIHPQRTRQVLSQGMEEISVGRCRKVCQKSQSLLRLFPFGNILNHADGTNDLSASLRT